MAMRPRRRRGGLFVLIGFLTLLAVTFGAGVYAGRIWMARSSVTVARVSEPETLRESLASAGHDARVVEGEASGPVYRVQVGEFATREAARAMAARLSGERSSVAPIITTR